MQDSNHWGNILQLILGYIKNNHYKRLAFKKELGYNVYNYGRKCIMVERWSYPAFSR